MARGGRLARARRQRPLHAANVGAQQGLSPHGKPNAISNPSLVVPCAPARYAWIMRRAIVVRGRLKGPRLIELEEPVEGVEAEVEVVLRESAPAAAEDDGESLIAV